MIPECFDYSVDLGGAVGDRVRNARYLVTRWLNSDGFSELADLFAVDDLPTSTMARLDRWIQSSKAFDYRSRGPGIGGYRERWHAASDPSMTSLTRSAVLGVARRLGLVDGRPPSSGSFSALLVMGGGFLAPQRRSECAANLLMHGGVDAGSVYLLGSLRPLDPIGVDGRSEVEVVASYAPNAQTEFDAMTSAGVRAFGCSPRPALVFAARRPGPDPTSLRWVSMRLVGSDGLAVVVLCARRFTEDDGRSRDRPNTADTFACLRLLHSPQPGDRCLAVTSQRFVPFQTFDALRVLGVAHGVDVEMVGTSANLEPPLTAESAMQEIRSSLLSARRLLVALSDRD